MSHNYSGCQLPACELCDAYNEGYAAGKDKAHAELRAGDYLSHPDEDGCAPCLTFKHILAQMRSVTIGRVLNAYFHGEEAE